MFSNASNPRALGWIYGYWGQHKVIDSDEESREVSFIRLFRGATLHTTERSGIREPQAGARRLSPTRESSSNRRPAEWPPRQRLIPDDEPGRAAFGWDQAGVPVLPAGHVLRERLLAHLDVAVTQPVTLLCAPPGWGKTTLAASWIRAGRAPGRAAYVRFEGGSTPATWQLIHALIAARLAINPMTYAWTDARPGERAVVVLDDLHNITDSAGLDRLERLIARLGDRVAFVLLARTEPPLSLYRWRVRGQLTDLRTDHLSFGQEETADLLAAHRITLSEEARYALWQATDGWPATLRFAVEAMMHRGEPERVIGQLVRGESRLSDEIGITEFVRREILHQLPGDMLGVMLRTSIVETVCPGLVEAMTGQPFGARMLVQLSRANALATFYGGGHSWYRYRRQLRTLLRAEAHATLALEIPLLHRAAASWYAANGLPSDALGHTLAAGDWTTAERLFGQHWPELTGSSPRTIPPHAAARPPDDIGQRPLLALALAIRSRDTSNLTGMTAYARLAERAVGDRAPAALAEVLAGARVAEALALGDSAAAGDAAVRLLASTERAEPVNDAGRALALITIAGTRIAARDLDAADLALHQGLDLAERCGVGQLELSGQRQMAYAHLSRGRLAAASACARRIIDGARDAGIVEWRNVSLARIVLAFVSLERALLDEAAYHLDQALTSTVPHDRVTWQSAAIPRARLRFARGDLDGATAALVPLRDARVTPWNGLNVMLLDAEILVARGRLGPARDVLANAPAVDPVALAAARLHLAEGNAPAAAAIARQVAAGPVDSILTGVDAAVLLAEALHRLGDVDAAITQIDRALRLAAPDGIRRPFVEHGAWIAEMAAARECEVSGEFAAVSAIAPVSPIPLSPVSPAPPLPEPPVLEPAAMSGPALTEPLAEPLTEREAMVLRYLRSMLSIAEIASMLSVSANTIKTHVRHVYRKLGVSRRRDAVRRARELRLL
jgi:LuxR family maltose regulon positive regulatory protein